mmetsp:Transcript_12199/g.16891  ORF Transcript_12199/g.16891 Transcript_12199/m.16891 type:complete len:442 (+) Transcript_12199:79-1404(+)|eukprot:jgi/Bigna1/85038/estExt_fgenesh1_pg.C_20003
MEVGQPLSKKRNAFEYSTSINFNSGGEWLIFSRDKYKTLLLVVILMAIVHGSNSGLRQKKDIAHPVKHGARRQALLHHPSFPSIGYSQRRLKGLSAEKLLSVGQQDTLASIQKSTATRNSVTEEIAEGLLKAIQGASPTQGLDPVALIWNRDLLDNMVQMAHGTELFNSVLHDTEVRVQQMLQDDTELLAHLGKMQIIGRVKTPESITRKILFKSNQWKKRETFGFFPANDKKRHHISKVYDVVGLRIILDSNEIPNETGEERAARELRMCYRVQELISRNWETILFRGKDYIEKPKANGYQSLHLTAVVNYHLTKIPVEFQIRTAEMEKFASNGPAAHNRYKENVMDDLLFNSFPINSPKQTNQYDHDGVSVNQSETEPPIKQKKKHKRRRFPRTRKPALQTKGSSRKSRSKDRLIADDLEYVSWLATDEEQNVPSSFRL